MKISAYHILRLFSLGLRVLTVSLLLSGAFFEVQAQSDTCFVSIDITRQDAFALINGSRGTIRIENGQQMLVTPCQILKVVNQSTGEAIDKHDGRFRVLTFEAGAATTYDYARSKTGTGLEFTAVQCNNMRSFIYFLLPNRDADLTFRLENDKHTEHHLLTRREEPQPMAVPQASQEGLAPADKKPVEANALQSHVSARETPAAVQPSEPEQGEASFAWLPWLIALLAVAGAGAYAVYLRRQKESELWADPLGGGDENILPAEQRMMVKMVRDLQQRLQASIASDRDHSLRLEHSEKDRKEAVSRAQKAEEDFMSRATKAEEDFKNRASIAEKDFSKRAEQAEKSAEDRTYAAEQQARSRVAAAQQKSEQEIAAAQQRSEQEIALARERSEQAIAAAQQQSATEIEAAQKNAETEITAARQLAQEQIAQALKDKVDGIEAAREEAYQRATREYNAEVAAIRQEATERIRTAEEQAREISETAQQVANDAINTKQDAIDEACEPLLDQIRQLETDKAALESAIKQVNAERDYAVRQIKTDAEALVEQALSDKESNVAQALADKEAAIAQALAEKEAAVAQALAEKEQAVSQALSDKESAIQKAEEEKTTAIQKAEEEKTAAIRKAEEEKEQTVAQAINDKETAVAQALQDKETAVAQAINDKETAVAQALLDKETAVAQAINDKETAVAQALQDKETAVAQAINDKETAVAQALKEKEEGIALYRNNYREEHLNERNQLVAQIKGLLDRVSEQMVLMKEGIETLGTDNNYSNTTMHMARKQADFVIWFEKNVLEAGEEGPQTAEQVRQLLQEQFTVLLSGNYSWLTELIRFQAYAGISATFQREFKRAGIPVEAIRSAHTAMTAILGMLNISVVVPQLFAEEFCSELHRNCNTPIVNSFYPKGFDEHRQQLRGIICDVLRVGVELNGQNIQVPEVSTF